MRRDRVLAMRWAAAGLAALGAAGTAFAGGDESALLSALAPFVDQVAAGAPLPDSAEGGGSRDGARERDLFDDFARPVTNLSFHHPFIWNEIRPVFADHSFPEKSAVGGGGLRVLAAQVHAKLSDDFQFTAYKDGRVWFRPDAVIPHDQGWADLAAGVKYRFWHDDRAPAIFTVGLGYETTSGDSEILQNGTGLFDLFGSYARKCGDWHMIGTAGFLLPQDTDDAVRTFHGHLHLDYPLSKQFSPLLEIHCFKYLSNGERNAGLGPASPLGFEGFDYANLGSDDVKGNTVATAGLGFRWFVSDCVSIGAAYELPITHREDLFDSRFTMDLVFRF